MLPRNYADRTVCVIGLGYVGLTLAVVMAEAGFDVIGVERNPDVVASINAGVPPFAEKGLAARLASQVTGGGLTASQHWPQPGAVRVYVVTVGTPLGADGKTNLAAISEVSHSIAERLRPNDLVVLRSTVRVGVTNTIVRPILEQAGHPFGLAFCPERTVEGKALEELRSLPQVVGGYDNEAAVRAGQMFAMLTPTVIRVSSLETAEMIKLLNNTQRDLMFAFANEIAGICDDVGVSASEVIRAGNVGYARAFMPFPGPVGGPCLEKDPYILAESTSDPEGMAQLALLGRRVNERLPARAIAQIAQLGLARPPRRIAIFGLAFKGRPETSDLRGTLAIRLIADLKATYPDALVCGYDPIVPLADIAGLGIAAMASAREAAADADVILFQNNNPQFETLDLNDLAGRMIPGGIVYDFWSQFDPSTFRFANDVRYCALGSLNLA